jgi:hypothetical protein
MHIKGCLLLLLVLTRQTQSLTCHYSCANCSSSLYSACTLCPSGNALTYRITIIPDQGTCAPITTGNENLFGILYLIFVSIAAVAIFNEEMMHLVLFIQSLGLLYLVEVNWGPYLDYVMSGLSNFMPFTKMLFRSKVNNNPYGYPQICKGRLFFGQFDLLSNMLATGLANLLTIFFILLIACLKPIRKRCVKERVRCFPDWMLDKGTTLFCSIFILLIQETTAIIYFSLKYG